MSVKHGCKSCKYASDFSGDTCFCEVNETYARRVEGACEDWGFKPSPRKSQVAGWSSRLVEY